MALVEAVERVADAGGDGLAGSFDFTAEAPGSPTETGRYADIVGLMSAVKTLQWSAGA